MTEKQNNTKHIFDLSTYEPISMEDIERILLELLEESEVKFAKFYSSSSNKNIRSKQGKYIEKKHKIVIYEVMCDDNYSAFLQFMIEKRIKKIKELNSTLK